jgi:uncharacterized membrane protein YphA (DoxX/SURF4 family)
MYNSRKREVSVWITVFRIILALVFIASGFLKGVDPWGTSIKTGEYLSAAGLEWLTNAASALAIGQCAFEMWLGLLLLFNRLRGFARFFTMLSMLFFTALTLIIALTDPIHDCGCFGDAIKLTNWETFFKNLVLLPMSVALFMHTRKEIVTTPPRGGIVLITLVFALFPPLWAEYSLPWIDFLPYKVGTNIPAGMYVAPEDRGVTHTTLLYKNLETEAIEEFEMTDTVWYDTTRYAFVDTRVTEISKGKEPEITNFVLFDDAHDVTDEILAEDEAFLLVADRLEDVDERDARRFGRIARWTQEKGIRTICLTTSALSGSSQFQRKIGLNVPCYNIDATTLKTLIRAHRGVVILERGTILAKKNLRLVPRFEKAGVDSALEFVTGRMASNNEKTFVILYALILIILLFSERHRCKN